MAHGLRLRSKAKTPIVQRGFDGPSGHGNGQLRFRFEGGNSRSSRNESLINLLVGKLEFRTLGFDSKTVPGARTPVQGLGHCQQSAWLSLHPDCHRWSGAGGDGVDRFRLKVWNEKTGETVFDNQMGAAMMPIRQALSVMAPASSFHKRWQMLDVRC